MWVTKPYGSANRQLIDGTEVREGNISTMQRPVEM